MEALTRIVSDSLARYGLDRPVDPRRLQWSRWFRCDSPHSLLVVPSKPGIFGLAEEIMDLGSGKEHPETAALGCPAERSSVACAVETSASAADVISKRMLAVIQFSEDDNMAYVLDRMFSHINPMRARLHSGNCFVRFVVVEDQQQRRTICAALNQWMRNSAEKATGFPSDFSSSLEMPRVGRTLPSASSGPALGLTKGQPLSAQAGAFQAPTKGVEPGEQADSPGANTSPD
ncbi:MAG: hypothetical protein WAK22_10140, partial [Candidatus Sulfotelmatobacter sp.]